MKCWRCSYSNPLRYEKCEQCGGVPCCLGASKVDGKLICADCDLVERRKLGECGPSDFPKPPF